MRLFRQSPFSGTLTYTSTLSLIAPRLLPPDSFLDAFPALPPSALVCRPPLPGLANASFLPAAGLRFPAHEPGPKDTSKLFFLFLGAPSAGERPPDSEPEEVRE